MEEKVAIYCRVSTQMQSTDRQKDDLLKLAAQFGYTVNEENIYIDIISGFSSRENRPQYCNLLHAIEEGGVTTILFSELSRLGRNSTELLKEIEFLKGQGVNLYFEKQNVWVKRDIHDVTSTIFLHVLVVMAEYEIELFAERTISGKIKKISRGGGIGIASKTYGYMNNSEKNMSIREDEAKIVREIFQMYADGKSVIEIAESLNANNIPSPYTTRIHEFRSNRKKKGLGEKEYAFDVEKLKWRPSAISRMLCNEIYIGHRVVEFHKPQVGELENNTSNNKKLPKIYTYDERLENIRIVSDDIFYRVQERLSQAKYNKNISIKHENLLKAKLRCGECGSNFSVGKVNESATNYKCDARTYKCYGRVNRKDKPQTCKEGAEVRQWKLDGLVVMLSLRKFAEGDFEKNNQYQIEQLTKEINKNDDLIERIKDKLVQSKNKYEKELKRLISISEKSDEVVEELMRTRQNEYEIEKAELSSILKKKQEENIRKRNRIKSLKHMSEDYANLYDKIDEIKNNTDLLKSMIDEYIDVITLYRIHKLWNLVVIKYRDGSEFWGTIKAARYKNSETFYDPLLSKDGIEFQTWVINNSNHRFTYNKTDKTVTCHGDKQSDDKWTQEIPEGTYTYEEFNKILHDKELIGSYPMYAFELRQKKQIGNQSVEKKLLKEDIKNNIDWVQHNKDVFEKLRTNKR